MAEITLRQLNRLKEKPMFSVKDPVSALTHFIGFLAAVILTPVLLIKAAASNSILLSIGAAIYSLSLILLYGASTSYHSFILPKKASRILKKLDHMSIFVLIAGSYTPICLSMADKHSGTLLLIAVWVTALMGIIMKAFWVYCPKYVSSIIYIAMGWLAVFKLKTIYLTLGTTAFAFLMAGGILYTAGGVIYALKLRFSEDWGEHELFHVFALLGSLAHYITMLILV